MPTIEEIFKEKQDKGFSINEIFSEDKKKETIKPSEETEFEKAFGTLTNAEIIAPQDCKRTSSPDAGRVALISEP